MKKRLNDRGIVAINVGSVNENSEVFQFIRNTMASVYKTVYFIKVPFSSNFMVFVLDYDYSPGEIKGHKNLKFIVSQVKKRSKKVEFDKSLVVLTDDKAPIEIYTDKMILSQALGSSGDKH